MEGRGSKGGRGFYDSRLTRPRRSRPGAACLIVESSPRSANFRISVRNASDRSSEHLHDLLRQLGQRDPDGKVLLKVPLKALVLRDVAIAIGALQLVAEKRD